MEIRVHLSPGAGSQHDKGYIVCRNLIPVYLSLPSGHVDASPKYIGDRRAVGHQIMIPRPFPRVGVRCRLTAVGRGTACVRLSRTRISPGTDGISRTDGVSGTGTTSRAGSVSRAGAVSRPGRVSSRICTVSGTGASSRPRQTSGSLRRVIPLPRTCCQDLLYRKHGHRRDHCGYGCLLAVFSITMFFSHEPLLYLGLMSVYITREWVFLILTQFSYLFFTLFQRIG